MNAKQLAEVLVEYAGGSIDQREQELRDLIWTASINTDFRHSIERAMKTAAREMRYEMEDR